MSKQSSRHTPCVVTAQATDGGPAPAVAAICHGHRRGFTLVELLVAITIIGILSAMTLGGMYRANVAAKQVNTKTTINKVAAQISEIWESYRTRKLPIDPKQVLSSNGNFPYAIQYPYAVGWLQYFNQVRTVAGASVIFPDPQAPPTSIPPGVNPNNNLQIAALRLAATRELMRLELPCGFADFTSDYTQLASAPPVVALLIPQPMNGTTPAANPGGLSEQYRQFYQAHATTANLTYESAECLYMIIKFASQNDYGAKTITDDPRLVGDSDGDGMPEIQDAFLNGTSTPAPLGSAYVQRNMPIAFIRWPAGFLSDLQPGPTESQYQSASTVTYEYAASRHDIFDPLRIDPRAFAITPLVFSAGVDGTYDVWERHLSGPAGNDPYFTDNTPASPAPIFPISPNSQNTNPGLQDPLPGAVMDPGTIWPNGSVGSGGYADNITNHLLSTRAQ